MSRSVKKSLIAKQSNSQMMKRLAVKKARRFKDLQNGSAYKKLLSSWNICDWKFRSTLDEYKKQVLWYYQMKFPKMSSEQLDRIMTKDYYKEYRRK